MHFGSVEIALLFGFAILAGVLLSVLARSQRRKSGIRPGGPGPHQPVQVPADRMDLIRAHIAANKKIMAIKELREATGLGLKEAKDWVDAMAEGHPGPGLPGRGPAAGVDGTVADRARTLKAAGDHGAAAALVRQETGMSRDEAEQFVAQLADPGVPGF